MDDMRSDDEADRASGKATADGAPVMATDIAPDIEDDIPDDIVASLAPDAAFFHSELFARTFREGMALVEQTANYLDGEGRTVSRDLPRAAALAYAGVSMRLTTQLMQIASWLLVLRAVREGDMTAAEAAESKYRVPAKEPSGTDARTTDLPPGLVTLIGSANRLYDRIARIDGELFGAAPRANDAAARLRTLKAAFGG